MQKKKKRFKHNKSKIVSKTRQQRNPVQQKLLQKIEALGERLPPNTLDQLIDELGGPDTVAEV